MERWVFPVPEFPINMMFSVFSMYSQRASWSNLGLLRDGIAENSNWSSVFIEGNLACLMRLAIWLASLCWTSCVLQVENAQFCSQNCLSTCQPFETIGGSYPLPAWSGSSRPWMKGYERDAQGDQRAPKWASCLQTPTSIGQTLGWM